MNCPQCQERLDERLDELRSGLHGSVLSPDDARESAHRALEETTGDCPECAKELRAHLNVRLALMIPANETITVPPALRANVRRALEREGRASSSSRRPFGYAWAGGAIMSALVLFVVARPYLIERANAPMSKNSAPTFDSETSVGAASPQVGANSSQPKPNTGSSAASSSKKSVSPGKTSAPGSVRPMPAPLAPVQGRSSAGAPLPAATARVSPSPRLPSPRLRQNPAEGERDKPRLSPPRLGRSSQTPSKSDGASPPVTAKVPSLRPDAPKAKVESFAPTGQELGLTVRFVPAANDSARGVQQRNGSFRPPGESAPPSPAPNQEASSDSNASDSNASDSFAGAGGGTSPDKPHAARARPPLPSHRRPDDASSRNAAPVTSGETADTSSSATTSGTLSLAVEHDVTGARIRGQVTNKKSEPVVLWSGNALARQPISFPLTKLGAASGDTVSITIEQQSASGQTKTLATSTLVVP